ncbi:hypothetical protein RJ640_005160 [Escallonia rubra]|uniref:Retrotransposon gag domain-containing protein n=1 Tax=Escallonia rubra TaxID=112253 RepID=A0AA88RXZ8_9ASTE|nr:hypothetical protein RJ640_005160 [Escallonia rubra]
MGLLFYASVRAKPSASRTEISELKASVDHLKDELPFMRQSMTKLQHMMQQLLHIREEEGTNSRHTKWSKGNEQLYKEYHQTTSGNSSPKVPKLEFPRFSREDSYGWVRKAKGKVCWQEFTKDLHARFSCLFRESIIGEFHKLRQATTVEQYYNDFETLRSILVSEGSKFAEEYYIQGFISGLKDDIRLEVEKFDVGDLSKAIFLARKQEASLQNSWHNPRIGNRAHLSTPSSPVAKVPFLSTSWKSKPISTTQNHQPTHIPPQTHKGLLPNPNQPPTQKFTRGFFDERRRKGLCYWCDEVFTPAHSCKHIQVSMLVVDEEESGDIPPIYDEEPPSIDEAALGKEDEKIEITVNAITGNPSHNTFKLWGQHHNKLFSILMDTGSTHNFIDPVTAAKLGCVITPTTPMTIRVAMK